MNYALIFAGGTGQRMNTRAKPKQFLELHGKPILIYTIEHFEYHPLIDDIIVVCIESYINELKHLLKLYDIRKVTTIIPGGDGGDISIRYGLDALKDKATADDIVLIHDGVRPLINEKLITDNILKVKEKGNAITVEPVTESVVKIDENSKITEVPKRSQMFSAKAPQSFRYGDIFELYQKAHTDNVRTIDSSHLCSIYGVDMFTVDSTPNNIKITKPTDYYIFRALFEAMENQQILGV
jgi:2-C-methyl-D-erythritol 4-phosphate cytidylyltransferase